VRFEGYCYRLRFSDDSKQRHRLENNGSVEGGCPHDVTNHRKEAPQYTLCNQCTSRRQSGQRGDVDPLQSFGINLKGDPVALLLCLNFSAQALEMRKSPTLMRASMASGGSGRRRFPIHAFDGSHTCEKSPTPLIGGRGAERVTG
jgi:hypothetical protein